MDKKKEEINKAVKNFTDALNRYLEGGEFTLDLPCGVLSDKTMEDAFELRMYRNVKMDAEEQLSQNPDISDLTEEEYNQVIESVARRYAYDRKYDCTLSYWENIDSLANDAIENIRQNRQQEDFER